MATLAYVAMRNVLRNPRRTMLTLCGISLGIAAAVFIHAFALGFLAMVTGLLAEGTLGAIQVHRAGFVDAEEEPLKLDLPQQGELPEKIRSTPGVAAVTPRITFEALLGNGTQATMVLVAAVDIATETAVCAHRYDAVKGHAFTPTRAEDVLVGRHLLLGMDAAPGSLMTLQATTRAGGTNALDAHVLESLGTTDQMQSKRRVEMTLGHAQTLLGMEGRVTEYALAVMPGVDVNDVAAALRQNLGAGYQVSTWVEMAADIADVIETLTVIMGLLVLMLCLLVLSGIANTLLTAVHERTREIGMMLAMGMRRRQVMTSFVLEAGVLGVLGGVAGALLGYAVSLAVQHTGFPVKPPESDIDNYLRPVPSVLFACVVAPGCALGAMVASLWPARRAARLTPVEALRNE